jgi:hypothetical protein
MNSGGWVKLWCVKDKTQKANLCAETGLHLLRLLLGTDYWLLGDGMSCGRWGSWLPSRLTWAPTQGIFATAADLHLSTDHFSSRCDAHGILLCDLSQMQILLLGSPQCICKWCGSVVAAVIKVILIYFCGNTFDLYSWTSWPLKMGPIRCPETSIKDYHWTLRYTPEERRFDQHRGGSLKSRWVALADEERTLNLFDF